MLFLLIHNKGVTAMLNLTELLHYFYTSIDWFLGTPLTLYVVIISIVTTATLNFIQFRKFFTAWRLTFSQTPAEKTITNDMSPIQAFINTLSANLGNGSFAGMATAVYMGGPGAALWAVIIGFLLMSVRFAEVYISTIYGKKAVSAELGGPMLYLQDLPFGKFIAYVYGCFLFLFAMSVGNAIQANSICDSIQATWGISPYIIAIVLFAFVIYIIAGGAPRIVKASDAIVPVKVILFFGTSIAIVLYHYQSLPSALSLIWTGAFQVTAIAGGALGYTMQQAMRYGIDRSIMATESGLGTAAVLFGFTGSNDALKNGLMAMLSTFISTLVCFLVALCIIVSGVFDTGLEGITLTMKAYESLFGSWGGPIANFLSISFGMGVLVTFAYISHAAWRFLTGGRLPWFSGVLYCIATGIGALAKVSAIWYFASVVNAALLVINLLGILWLLPVISAELNKPNNN